MKGWNELGPSPEYLHREKRQPAVSVGFDQDSHLGNENFLSLVDFLVLMGTIVFVYTLSIYIYLTKMH